MIKRDKYFENKKYINSIKNRIDEIKKELKNKIKIPLDKPQFIGWNLSPRFREEIKNRLDYPILLEVLEILSNSYYVNNIKLIKFIRSSKHHITSTYYFGINNNIKAPIICCKRYISIEDYKKLNDRQKSYFSNYSETHPEFRKLKCYFINDKFPFKSLLVKIEKSFFTHKIIPNGELESELKKLKDIYFNNHLDRKQDKYNSYNKKYLSSFRNQNKLLGKIYTKYLKCNPIDEIEELEDWVIDLRQRTRLDNKKETDYR